MSARRLAVSIGLALALASSTLLAVPKSVARPPTAAAPVAEREFAPVTLAPSPRATPSPTPSPSPTASPSPTPSPTPRPSPQPKAVAPIATPKPTPKPIVAGWPVKDRTSYVTQFSNAPDHIAIDIGGATGKPVIPIRSGRTVFAGWFGNGGGYQVWVRHGNGLYSTYNHMARETSYRGEWVTGGVETIGYVGATGYAHGAHLHIEVWHGYPWRAGSYPVNPWRYINQGYWLPRRYR